MSAFSLTAPDRARAEPPAGDSDLLAPVFPIRDVDMTPGQVRTRHLEGLSAFSGATEDRFDRITALASSLFGVPMAAVSLIDGDTALYSASPGYRDEQGAVERDHAFGDSTVRAGRLLVVEDATADARFADLPVVIGAPYLRFYAGVPLNDDDGVTVGTFALYDTVPRRLDRAQMEMLIQLASWARRELVDSADMSRARQVQRSLLPTRSVAPPGYSLAAVCEPTKGVGGDFYDHSIVADRFFLTLVDVMGKGVGAALVAASVRAMLRASLTYQLKLSRLTDTKPGSQLKAIVTATDRLLADDLGQTGTLVTGFASDLRPRTGELTWVDAGHGLALIVRTDGTAQRLAGQDMPVGLGLGSTWTEHQSVLNPGDTLLVVSDGLFDLLGGTEDAFERITYLVRTDPEPHMLIERISELTAMGTALDDVTAVALRRTPEA